MSRDEDIALIRRLYDAFAAGDAEVVTATFADDVVWHEGGTHASAGEYTGLQGVLEVNQRAAALTDGTLSVEVHDVLGSDDHVVVLQTATASRDGRRLSVPEVLTIHVRDAKVVEVWVAYPDPRAAEALFG